MAHNKHFFSEDEKSLLNEVALKSRQVELKLLPCKKKIMKKKSIRALIYECLQRWSHITACTMGLIALPGHALRPFLTNEFYVGI